MRQTLTLPWPFVRRTLFKLSIVLLVGIWTTGCVPMRYTSGPGAKGLVVDLNSQAPIQGAFVTLTRSVGSGAQTSTSKYGEFHIGSRHRWYMYNLFNPSKPILQPAVLSIQSPGFETFATNTAPGLKMLDLGVVRLKALPQL